MGLKRTYIGVKLAYMRFKLSYMGLKLTYMGVKLSYMRPKLKGTWGYSMDHEVITKEALVIDELTQ